MDKQLLLGNPDQVKQLNRSAILKTIHKYGPISKAVLSSKSKLTFATVSNIITDLYHSGIVEADGYGSSSGGRKPILYRINWDNVYVIGLDVGVTKVTTALINLKGKIIFESSINTCDPNGNGSLIKGIYKSVDHVFNSAQDNKSKISGIGISAPGPIDADSGKLLSPPNLAESEDLPIGDLIHHRYGLVTVVEKDANAAALGEQWFGSVLDQESVIYIFADQGIGGGIIIGGRIYRGFMNGAGEIGHMSIDVDGPRCNCGNFGCLEALASGIAIIRRVKEELHRGVPSSLYHMYLENEEKLTLEQVINHARDGDHLAKDIMDEAGRYLGIGLGNIINFFNPQEVILGGEIINGYPNIIKTIKGIAKKRAFSQSINNFTIRRSRFGEHSGVIGAASIVQQQLFDAPQGIIL